MDLKGKESAPKANQPENSKDAQKEKDGSQPKPKDASAVAAKDASSSPARDASAVAAKDASSIPAKDASSSPAKDASSGPAAPVDDKSAFKKVFASPRYMIRTFRWKQGEGKEKASVVEGESILSETLKRKVFKPNWSNAGEITLSGMRKLIPEMSAYPRLHKFCTSSGIVVSDETISFEDYLGLDRSNSDDTGTAGNVPSVKIYFLSATSDTQALKDARPALNLKLEDRPDAQAPTLKSRELVQQIKEEKITHGAAAVSAGTLTEAQWTVVLRNCAVFYGWIIDESSRRIRPAPKPAFQLRSKIYTTQDALPDFRKKLDTSASDVAHKAPTSSSDTKENPKASAKQRDEHKQSDEVKARSERTDLELETPVEQPVRRPHSLANLEATGAANLEILDLESKKRFAEAQKAEEAKRVEDAKKVKTKEDELGGVVTETVTPPPLISTDKKDKGIPNFRVNDNSLIEVTACTTELMVSFAKNDFSSQSTEVSASGGAGGVTVGASAGYAKSQSKSVSGSQSNKEQTLVARYKFPRCDILLGADELEPTPEMAALLKKIEEGKDIKDLRELHRSYGQLFCQNITLGGRLLSTKMITMSTTTSASSEKEQFKTSVGASVNTPYGGASVKHEQAKGTETSQATSKSEDRERHVFEAVGGDTILANNPPAWATTVGIPENWRVIERDGLSSLVTMLSKMPGYQAVESWFVRAVPTLSQYLLMDESHSLVVRFKVNAPTNSLCRPNTPQAPAVHYLGHQTIEKITPRLGGIVEKDPWGRYNHPNGPVLFNPNSYAAPVLLGFENFKVGDMTYGKKYNKEFTEVQWRMTAPFTDRIIDKSRVILQTMPFVDPKVAVKEGEVDASAFTSRMVVFRNAEGQFVPGMSDHDEHQFWRILKPESSGTGKHIKAGDEIRLCWAFSDQTTGFRDWKDDTFGRRQNGRPADYPHEVLYLKVPWPRFEVSGVGTGLIMSGTSEEVQHQETIMTTQGPRKFVLQDLKFRLDRVEGDGKIDANDYLLGTEAVRAELTRRHAESGPIIYFLFGVSYRPPITFE